MLKGPTGCGKTRFVEHMAWRLAGRCVTVACHDDLSASDLTGRYLVRGERHGVAGRPAHAAPRGMARSATSTRSSKRGRTPWSCIHPLTDDRRVCCRSTRRARSSRRRPASSSSSPTTPATSTSSRTSSRARASASSRSSSTSRRRISRRAIVGARRRRGPRRRRAELVTLAIRLRQLRDRGLAEVPSTRLLVAAARLIARGYRPERLSLGARRAPRPTTPTSSPPSTT